MKRFLLFLSAVVLFLFVGCNNEEPEQNIPDTIVFSLDKQEVSISPEGGSVDVVVYSSQEWTIEGTSDWCTPSATGGDANEEGQNVSFSAELSYDSREATFLFCCADQQISLVVSQKLKEVIVPDSNNTFTLTASGGEVTLAYQTNVECEVVIPEEAEGWISTASDTKALTAASATLQVAENTTYYERSAVVKVVMIDNHNIVAEYTISQQGQECFIEYTSVSGSVVEPYWTTDDEGNSIFGANIVSNSYENGVGRIYFDAPISSIGYFAFGYMSSLKSIIIPSCVTSIGDYAFTACEGLQSVTIPEGVTAIGNCAFEWCGYLKNITIPESVTTFGDGVLAACSNLEKISGKFASADGRAVIVDGVFKGLAPKKLTSYTIPEGVTTIGASSFYGSPSLQSVTIPESVTSIGASAFINCMVLKTITLPSGLISIGDNAFLGCTAIRSITIPESVSSIGDGAFSLCSNLAEIKGKFTTEDNRAVIVDGVLKGVAPKQLTSYTIPEGVTAIGKAAFANCSELYSITIPESVTVIDDEAFLNCPSLKSLTLPDNGVTSIGYMAFADCTKLKTVTLPNSITLIDECAFLNCSELSKVYCKAPTPPTLGYDVFYDNASSRYFFVPTESVDAYKSADYWSDYADSIRGYDF